MSFPFRSQRGISVWALRLGKSVINAKYNIVGDVKRNGI